MREQKKDLNSQIKLSSPIHGCKQQYPLGNQGMATIYSVISSFN